MLKSLQSWDPEFDLQKATKEQRLSWRRAFAINWLSDLVNARSSVVVERRALEKQNIDLESVDWSSYEIQSARASICPSIDPKISHNFIY